MRAIRPTDLVTVTPYEDPRGYVGRVVEIAYDAPVLGAHGQVVKPVRAARVDLGDRTIVALHDELAPVDVREVTP